jgi:selenocysteine lyase/cysteine desulfurase
MSLESYFAQYRENIIGQNQAFIGPYGEKELLYADWTASGRLYRPIEEKMTELVAPFIGNTHSESNITGGLMTQAYHRSHQIIKQHVNANNDDVIITAGAGMTAVINKFQRILGLRIPEQLRQYVNFPKELKPVVFVTHMEHHSNQTSWLETIADVVVIPPTSNGLVDVQFLRDELPKYADRTMRIGAFTACSNVTGICTPYQELARIMHDYNGFCFVDFAASAPYVNIDMHPEGDPDARLDAIYFSPHKFLGGPGTSGVLIFNSKLYSNSAPDEPGGGTVKWTNPWGKHSFIDDIESREAGGTPGFLQAIRTAMCIELKDAIGADKMIEREEELLPRAFAALRRIPGMNIMAEAHQERLGIISFHVDGIHYNQIVRLLNDRYGIQVRGGCSCAGTYGHYLLHLDPERSKSIMATLEEGDQTLRPGWVRLSVHPTMSDADLDRITDAIAEIVDNIDEWSKDYTYDLHTNEFVHNEKKNVYAEVVDGWFSTELVTDASTPFVCR